MTAAADPSPPSLYHLQWQTADIYRCLAPCNECTGNYVSELLEKRFICHCPCHYHHHDKRASYPKKEKRKNMNEMISFKVSTPVHI